MTLTKNNKILLISNSRFKRVVTDGKGTMGWGHGFKQHFIYNDRGEVIMFCLVGANVDDGDSRGRAVLGKRIYGKLFADRGDISPRLFDALSCIWLQESGAT